MDDRLTEKDMVVGGRYLYGGGSSVYKGSFPKTFTFKGTADGIGLFVYEDDLPSETVRRLHCDDMIMVDPELVNYLDIMVEDAVSP